MKRLTILRHAKSDWDDPVARDFDRPLNKRGERAAVAVGRFARQQGMQFDLVVASPAVRVVDTLDQFHTAYGASIETLWDRRIYLASAPNLIDVVADISDSASSVLMAGHNPGLEDLILTLVPDDADDALRHAVEIKFPTASLAVLELDIDHWREVEDKPARLLSFTRPRDLDPALGPENV